MKKTAVESLLPYLKGARYISAGTTAVCFLMKNDKVIKIFLNTYRKRQMFKIYDNIIDHFDEIYQIKNDSFIVPEELLIKDGKCIAYIYDYINARELNHLRYKMDLYHLMNAYDKLLEDTYEVSEKNFYLCDVHDKNILFNTKYKVIDLDKGYFSKETPTFVFQNNIMKINKTILYALIGEKPYNEIKFNNKELNKLYTNAIYGTDNEIKELFKALKEEYNINTVLDMKLKTKKLVNTWHNDYYKNYD